MGEDEYLMFDRLTNSNMASFIFICIIAPFTEEVLFRGIILNGFLKNYSVNHAIILSAVLFALFHFTIVQLPVAFIMGCFLGWLYVQTGSLALSIFAHALYNFCSILFSSTQVDTDNMELLLTPIFNTPEILFASLLSTFIGIKLLMRILHNQNNMNNAK
jgi:membrane protease YdiL (CAAX protease family)